MNYRIDFLSKAERDLNKLDRSVQIKVLKKIKRISENPFTDKHLGKKAGIDLSGYYKAYADKKKIRIIYRVDDRTITVLIVAIGRRSDLEVYKKAAKRLIE